MGGVATLVYWAVLLFLAKIRHFDPTLSSVIAYICGLALSFAGHRAFTYGSKAAIHGELGRFLATYALCFCAGNFVFWLASHIFKWDTLIAGALLTACNISLSYVVAELWIFRPRPPAKKSGLENRSDGETGP